MGPMSATVPWMTHQVDPRDEAWEVDRPRYRVHFWQLRDGGWVSDEWELPATDVIEAFWWSEEHADRGVYQMHAVVPDQEGRVGLVTLYGQDPTAQPHSFADRWSRSSSCRCSRRRSGHRHSRWRS